MSQKNSGPPITQEDNYFAPKNWMKKLKVNSPFLAPFMSKNGNSYIPGEQSIQGLESLLLLYRSSLI
jgi:hypothetical protein